MNYVEFHNIYVDQSSPADVDRVKNYLRSLSKGDLSHILEESCEMVVRGEAAYPSSVRRMLSAQLLIRQELMRRRDQQADAQ